MSTAQNRKNGGTRFAAGEGIRLRRLARILTGTAAILLLVPALEARPKAKDKPAGPKRDPLAEYVQRMSGPAAVAVASPTLGSLWIDNGRLANMVADYTSHRLMS